MQNGQKRENVKRGAGKRSGPCSNRNTPNAQLGPKKSKFPERQRQGPAKAERSIGS